MASIRGVLNTSEKVREWSTSGQMQVSRYAESRSSYDEHSVEARPDVFAMTFSRCRLKKNPASKFFFFFWHTKRDAGWKGVTSSLHNRFTQSKSCPI
jgi:hypothetical protein